MLDRIELHPQNGLAFGQMLLEAGRLADAYEAFSAVADDEPDNYRAASKAGFCLAGLKRYAEAEPWFDRAAQILHTELIMLTLNKSQVVGEQSRSEEGIALVRSVLRSQPDNVNALYNLGVLKMQVEDFESARADFERCLELDSTAIDGNARFCRGFANLVLGNYLEGFEDFEHRLKDNVRGGPSQGEELRPEHLGSLESKTVLILSEMGRGDMIQFGRYLPLLVYNRAHVLLVADANVGALFSGYEDWVSIVPEGEELPLADYWCHMMGLAHAFGTTVDSVPVPLTLKYDADLLREWREIIPDDGVLNVGLCWAGNPESRYDEHRSVPLAMLADLTREFQGKARFYGLQQTVRDSDVAAFDRMPLISVGFDFRDFRDTAHAMKCLDLVITVDTSVAHLAGTVGVPTWILVTRFRTYWLWIKGMVTTPWYPSVSLIRQPVHGSWPSAVEVVRERLLGMLVGRQCQAMPEGEA